MNRLQRNGTLPTVWSPPGPLRELRELTRWKNRLTATLAKYGAPASDHSDLFGEKKRAQHGFCLGGTPGKQAAGISRTFGSHGRHPFHILEYCRHGGRKLKANLSRLPKSSF